MAFDTGAAGLLFRISADPSNAEKEIKEFKKVIQKETKDAEREGSESLDDLGNSTDALATKMTAAVAVIGAVTIAVGAAARAFTQLIVSSSETLKEIGDLERITGLSVETLSSLKFATESAGESFEQIGSSLIQFSALLGDAEAGSKKAVTALAEFGLTPVQAAQDYDKALRTVLQTISDTEDPVRRAKLATDAFGQSGIEIISILRQFDGDLDALTAQAQEYGVVLSKDAVRAGEDFQRSLNIATAQVQGLATQIGATLLPAINQLTREMTRFLGTNQTEWQDWQRVATAAILTVVNSFRAVPVLIAGAFAPVEVTRARLQAILDDLKRQVQEALTFNKTFSDTASPSIEAQKRAAEEARKAREQVLKELDRQLQDSLQTLSVINQERAALEKEGYESAQQALTEAFKAREITEAEFRQKSLDNEVQFLGELENLFQAEIALRREAASGNELLRLQAEQAKQERLLRQIDAKERQKIDQTIANEAKKRLDEREDDIKLAISTENALYKENQEFLREYERLLDQQIEALENVLRLQQERRNVEREIADIAAESQRRILEADVVAANAPSARKKALEALREFEEEQARIRRDRELEDLEREEQAALERIAGKEFEEEQKFQIEELYRQKRLLSEEEFQKQLKEIREATAGGKSVFEQTIEDLKASAEAFQDFGDVLEVFRDIAARTFNAFAAGIGQMVQQWVIYGKTSGDVLRKVLAQTLATIAAEAAVRAVQAAAWGLLMLAMFRWDAAAQAFASAALWGGIAVGTALAGRAVAGNAFQRETSAGAGATGGQNSRGAASDGPGQTIDIARNAPFGSEARPTLVINDRSGAGFSQFLRFELENNTDTRGLIRRTVERS